MEHTLSQDGPVLANSKAAPLNLNQKLYRVYTVIALLGLHSNIHNRSQLV